MTGDGWLLTCNPETWDLSGFLRAHRRTLGTWTISRLPKRLEAGQPVLFWVAGRTAISGLHGAGFTAGRDYTEPGVEADFLVDGPSAFAGRRWLSFDIDLLSEPIPREELAADPRLATLQVFNMPNGRNPQRVTADQLTVIQRYLPPGAFAARGSARAKAIDRYRRAGWIVERSAIDGWDLTCRAYGDELRLAVRHADRIELGRAETVAANDPRWRLATVDGSTFDEYDGVEALARAEPISYAIRT